MSLFRIKEKEISIIGGVLAGLAYKLELESWKVRIPYIVLCVYSTTAPYAIILYLLAWVFLPKKIISKEEYLNKTNKK
jgi:phage shock protein PspC (stress-responsive transcriptional regulator)